MTKRQIEIKQKMREFFLNRKIEEFKSNLLPKTNKARIERIINCLTIVYCQDFMSEWTPNQQKTYYSALRTLEANGVC